MRRVLITGATGLIGKYALAPLLASGAEVYAVSRHPPGGDTVHWVRGDILDFSGLDGLFAAARPSHLLHLAWETRQGKYVEESSNFTWLAAGLEMLRRFHRHGGQRAVFVGTQMECQPSDSALSEDAPLAAATPYALCKNGMNTLGAAFCRKNGLSFAWGRLFSIYGAGEQEGRLTPSIIQAIRKGRAVTINCGSLVRDYMYAKDSADALTRLLLSPVEGTVNICAGRGIRLREFSQTLARLMGREDLLVFGDTVGDHPPVSIGNPARLNKEVGFLPSYDLRRGLSDLLNDA